MKQGNMEKLTKERKKTTERVSNGTDNNEYPLKSSGGFLEDRGDLLQKKELLEQTPNSPINTRLWNEYKTASDISETATIPKQGELKSMREQASKDSEELDLIPKKNWRCKNPTPPRNHRDLNQSRISTKVPAIFQKQQQLNEYGKPEKVRIVKQDMLEIDNTLPKLDRVSEPKI